jgi:WD40 repeat protein
MTAVRRRISWNNLGWILAPALAVFCAALAADSAPGRNSIAAQGVEIAFETNRGGSSDVFVLTGVKSAGCQVCNSGIEEAQPSPAPDGEASYASDRDGNYDIYAETSSGRVQVVDHPARDYSPAWSPDGTRIAFVSERFGNKDVFIASVDPGASFTRLTHSSKADMDPAWAPDGRRLAVSSNRAGTYDIWIMDVGLRQQLTDTRANDFEPAFSPAGDRVAFTRRNKFGNYDIYVIRTDGTELKRLTNSSAEDSEPTWSPEGDRIAFVSSRSGNYDIFVMSADGSGETNFSAHPAMDIAPTWKSNGRQLEAPARPETTLGGVTCGRRSGTARGETIHGTSSADVICGRGGNDKIFGGRGNDIIDGGPGKDMIDGGRGKDRIVARDGNKDKLFGGRANDRARTDGTPPDTRKSIEAPL